MKMLGFHHHPDNVIYLRDAKEGALVLKPEEFEVYLGQPYEGLPPGCRERRYDPANNVNFLFTNDGTQIDGGLVFREKGDAILSNYEVLKSAKIEAAKVEIEQAVQAAAIDAQLQKKT